MAEGRLEAIWIKRFKEGPMDSVGSAELVAGKGIKGNANQGGRRQVTIIAREVWEALMQKMSGNLAPSTRRANLMVSGIDLSNSRGKVLRIGGSRIRIFGETKPCELMEAALPGLRAEMYPDWRGGAFGELLNDYEIFIGDSVEWEEVSENLTGAP